MDIFETISRASRLLFGVFEYPTEEDSITNPEKSNAIKYIAKGLKEPTARALSFAAETMATIIKNKIGFSKPILIPVPDSKGNTSSNYELCEEILKYFEEGDIADLLGAEKRISSHSLRDKGLPGKTSSEILTFLKTGKSMSGSFVLIDNVITTGNTVYAAQRTLAPLYGKPPAVAFAISADPKEYGKKEYKRFKKLANVV